MTQDATALRLHAEIRRTPPPWMLHGLLIGVVCALLGPAISLAMGWDPVWLQGASVGWRIAHLSSLNTDSGVVAGVLATQAAIIFGTTLAWRWIAPRLPLHIGPSSRLVDAAALSAFQYRRLDEQGMDVLLYVDATRRSARIIAGRKASLKLDPTALKTAQDALILGAAADPEAAVSAAADILSRHV